MRRASIAAAAVVAALLEACGGGSAGARQAPGGHCGDDVFFSVANQDERTRDAEIKVVVDGQPVVYGLFRSSGQDEPADYHYVAAKAPHRDVVVRAVSPTEDGGLIEAEKRIPVRDGIWIVVTRVRDIDGDAELQIEFSYEGPVTGWGAGDRQ